ncbi:MAG: hypothetical protein K5696_09285 [Lachnospiraceae bacterium]|nr:hypothetical protein [Lachnospiraceae bacterium]
MQSCDNCHVRIRGHKAVCPLCGGELSGTPEDPAFPLLPKRRYTSRMVFKSAIFCFFALFVVMGTIRYLMGPDAAWTSAVMLWAPLGLAGLFITMAYRYNVLKLISAEVYIAMILNLLIDIATGSHGWAVAWVIPSLFLALTIALFVTAKALSMKIGEYLVYLLLAEVLSFAQIIFIVRNTNPHPWYAVIVMAGMLLFILAELIFLFQDFRSATVRTLHL